MELDLSGGQMGSNHLDSDEYDPDFPDPDSRLGPVDRLEKYIENENAFSRQLAARSLLETFNVVEETTDAERVLKAVMVLANDTDAVVRTELSELLSPIGVFCHENQNLFSDIFGEPPFSAFILPIIFRFVTDINNQVRKASQAALVDVLERDFIVKESFSTEVGPIISKLAESEVSEDYRAEAASLICKMAPRVGAEITEELFLQHFLQMCTDSGFHIRRTCAVNFGTMCTVLGQEKTEKILLEKFINLCTDDVWGVRKACTECFVQMSMVCSPATRHTLLSRLFINLIYDQARWVRMAAFEMLGAFISTFADPTSTGLRLTEDGTLVFKEPAFSQDETPMITSPPTDCSMNNSEPMSERPAAFDISSSYPTVKLLETSINRKNQIKETLDQLDDDFNFRRPMMRLFKDSNNWSREPDSSSVSEEKISGNVDLGQNLLSGSLALDFNYAKDGTGNEIDENISGNQIDYSTASNDICSDLEVEHSENVSSDKTGLEQKNESFVNGNQVVDFDGSVTSTVDQTGNENQINNGLRERDDERPADDKNDRLQGNQDTVEGDEKVEMEEFKSVPVQDETISSAGCYNLSRQKAFDGTGTDGFGTCQYWCSLVPELEQSSSEETDDSVVESSVSLNVKLRNAVLNLDNDLEEIDLHDDIKSNEKKEIVVSCNGGIDGLEGENDLSNDLGLDKKSSNDVALLEEESDRKGSCGEATSEEMVMDLRCHQTEESSQTTDVTSTSNIINESETVEISLDDDVDVIDLEASKSNEELVAAENQHNVELIERQEENLREDDDDEYPLCLDVDEDEVQELVAAAKDLPHENLAIYEQTVVPRDLLEQYLNMLDPSWAQKVDSEITRHCAYSLPAVAYTLGRKNWPSLKNLYTTLAADVQWKVRRTLAFSMHELAQIVGEEITSRDLVPVFDGFLNDLDEVRIGVLKHLADFLKLLSNDVRHGYLLKISDLLKTDNSRNWRFREELARQLYLLLDLFTAVDIEECICPIALQLAEDRVAQIRLAAFRVLGGIFRRLIEDDALTRSKYLDEMKQRFALSSQYSKRQMYVQLCNCILQDKVVNDEHFAKEFLQTLLALHEDAIPNVRITLARTLAEHIIHSEFYANSEMNPHSDELKRVVRFLEEDKDRDVRHLIIQKPTVSSSRKISSSPVIA